MLKVYPYFVFFLTLIFLSDNKIIGQGTVTPKFRPEALKNTKLLGDDFEKMFKIIETKKVNTAAQKNVVVLENGYAQSKIKNAKDWQMMKESYHAISVDVVYTKYPKDREFWLTDYHELLAKRLLELFKIDSTINDQKVRFSLVLQTACETQEEAKSMFHGFIIKYERRKTIAAVKPVTQMTPTEKIERYLVEVGGMEDSFVYHAFRRHPSWKKALVVMDMTGSMYQYAPQAVLWHLKNWETSGIKYFAYFNDGDRKPEADKKIGETGGIYFQEANKPEKLAKLFYTVMRNGYGGETLEENDCEAIIKAAEKFPDFDQLILVADNTSIRDFELLDKIKIPVKVVLVGAEWGINPQYLNLAYRTGGAIYSATDDAMDFLTLLDERDVLTIGPNKYKLNKKSNLFECLDEEACEYQFRKEEEAEQNGLTALKRSPVGKKMYKGTKNQKPVKKKKKRKKKKHSPPPDELM